LHELKRITVNTADLLQAVLRGGYPEPVIADNPIVFFTWMDNYFKTYTSNDVRRLFPRLDMVKYRRFITMLASLSGTIINKAQLGRCIDTFCSGTAIAFGIVINQSTEVRMLSDHIIQIPASAL